MQGYSGIANLMLALLGLVTILLVITYPLLERKIDEVAFKTNKMFHEKHSDEKEVISHDDRDV